MSIKPISIPERFVTTWAVVQIMPDDSYAISCLKEEAEQVIADPLRRAEKIAYAASLLRKAISEATPPGIEVNRG